MKNEVDTTKAGVYEVLKDMIEQAELKDKHKHLLQLEKSTIEERIDTAVPQENDGIF